jgi:hypothetical protein
MDCMAIMAEGSPYGCLAVETKEGVKGILPPVLSRRVGESLSDVEGWLAELEEHGVFSRAEDGTIYSRRMVRDEHNRQVRAAGGVKALDHPNVPKPKPPVKDTQKDTFRESIGGSFGGSPASASASASASAIELPATTATAGAEPIEQQQPEASPPPAPDHGILVGFPKLAEVWEAWDWTWLADLFNKFSADSTGKRVRLVAEIAAALDGMHGPTMTIAMVRLNVGDYLINPAEGSASMSRFRGYLYRPPGKPNGQQPEQAGGRPSFDAIRGRAMRVASELRDRRVRQDTPQGIRYVLPKELVETLPERTRRALRIISTTGTEYAGAQRIASTGDDKEWGILLAQFTQAYAGAEE